MNLRARLQRKNAPWLWIASSVVVLVIIGAVVGTRNPSAAYDPESFERNGTRGAVETLRSLGADVEVGDTVAGDTILLFRDNLSSEQSDQLAAWVREGGTLVVADSSSPLGAVGQAANPRQFLPSTLQANCNAPWVRGIESITPGSRTYPLLDVAGATSACFKVEQDSAFVVEHVAGLGKVVQVASADVFINENLNDTDNAVLLAALTDARSGQTITVLQADLAIAPEGGEEGIIDLIPGGVMGAFAQLFLATVVFALWRGRRLGNLVHERRPVELPSSSLVLAVGEMNRSANRTNAAARTLRLDARRRLSVLMATPTDIDTALLVSLVSSRTGLSEQRLANALVDGPIHTSEDLLHLSQELEIMQREVANVR